MVLLQNRQSYASYIGKIVVIQPGDNEISDEVWAKIKDRKFVSGRVGRREWLVSGETAQKKAKNGKQKKEDPKDPKDTTAQTPVIKDPFLPD